MEPSHRRERAVIVTFVGGPRHGNHQSVERLPHAVMADNPDGTQMQYERRPMSAGEAKQRIAVQVFYAPALMPIEEFVRRSRKLQVPADQM